MSFWSGVLRINLMCAPISHQGNWSAHTIHGSGTLQVRRRLELQKSHDLRFLIPPYYFSIILAAQVLRQGRVRV